MNPEEKRADDKISPAASVGDIKLTCLRGVLGPRTASMVLMLIERLRAEPPLQQSNLLLSIRIPDMLHPYAMIWLV